MVITTDIGDAVDADILKWYGHVCRMDDRWAKRLLECVSTQELRKVDRETCHDGVHDATE